MHEPDPALPVHPRTGLTALGFGRHGEPIWPILGGSSEHDDPGEESEEDADPEDDVDPDADPDDEEDPEGAAELGDPGKKALAAMKAKLKAAKVKLRTTAAELESARSAAGENDADKVRREAEQAATVKANGRIVRSEVRAAATGKLADPKDALTFLDLTTFEVDDDGEVDADEIAEAIDKLLADKPYLAAAGVKPPAKRFKGTGDGGPRGGSKKTLAEQIAELEGKGDFKAARRLKLSQLTNPDTKK